MAFPSKGDRVAHSQYGPGTITDLDVHHLHEYDPTNEKPHLQTDQGDHRHEGIF